jgi:coproporphyrinogen III oxidase-like Fe-S oxidoreductase
MNATNHQKKIVAALYELIPAGYVRRREINRVIIGRGPSYGIPLKQMLSLRQQGFVRAESDAAVLLVQQKLCTCSCDRWQLTDSGRSLARTLNVSFDEHSEFSATVIIARHKD